VAADGRVSRESPGGAMADLVWDVVAGTIRAATVGGMHILLGAFPEEIDPARPQPHTRACLRGQPPHRMGWGAVARDVHHRGLPSRVAGVARRARARLNPGRDEGPAVGALVIVGNLDGPTPVNPVPQRVLPKRTPRSGRRSLGPVVWEAGGFPTVVHGTPGGADGASGETRKQAEYTSPSARGGAPDTLDCGGRGVS
jgi:hypothetical protein